MRISDWSSDVCSSDLFSEIGLVSRAESGEWLLARDLDDLSLAELYESCNLRIPINEAHLPCHDDALGQDAIRTLDELRIPLRHLLSRTVSRPYDLPGLLPGTLLRTAATRVGTEGVSTWKSRW